MLHGTEAVFLLRMEHIRDLGHDTHFIRGLGFLATIEGEGVDTEGRGEIDLMVLIGANCSNRGKIPKINPLSGFYEVLAGDSRATGDNRGCPGGTTMIEKSGGPA